MDGDHYIRGTRSIPLSASRSWPTSSQTPSDFFLFKASWLRLLRPRLGERSSSPFPNGRGKSIELPRIILGKRIYLGVGMGPLEFGIPNPVWFRLYLVWNKSSRRPKTLHWAVFESMIKCLQKMSLGKIRRVGGCAGAEGKRTSLTMGGMLGRKTAMDFYSPGRSRGQRRRQRFSARISDS